MCNNKLKILLSVPNVPLETCLQVYVTPSILLFSHDINVKKILQLHMYKNRNKDKTGLTFSIKHL